MSLDMDQLQYSLIKHDAVEGNPTKEPIKQPNASHGPSESKEAIEFQLLPYAGFTSAAKPTNIDAPILSSPDDLRSFARWAFKGEPNTLPYFQSRAIKRMLLNVGCIVTAMMIPVAHKRPQDKIKAPWEE
ncbi:hypothetical protein MYU51_019639 [Penicillium brevicompactum]